MLGLSIVIVNWNTKKFLGDCLQSIYETAGTLNLEVIVVDNNSSDGSAELVRQNFGQVKLIANSSNLGYAKGNNQGIRESRGRYILLLNPDTIVLPGSLKKLVEFMEEHPQAGAVAPKLVYPDGSLQYSVRSFPTLDCLIYETLYLQRLFPKSRTFGKYRMTYWDYNEVKEVDQPAASALLLCREALEEVGLMDERFFLLFNDVDLCYRLKEAGWKIYFFPEAKIVHFHGQSTKKVRRRTIIESHLGLYRFYRKHYRGKMFFLFYWLAVLLIFSGGFLRLFFSWLKGER